MVLKNALRNITVCMVAVASFSLSCTGSQHADVREKTVASVGDEKISVRDVRELFGVRSAVHKVFGVSTEKKREALDRLIAGRLLSEESRRRGYDQSEVFLERYAEGEKDLYIATLFKEKVDRKVKVEESDIRAEAQKLVKANDKLKQEEAVEKATQKLYQDTFRERDNILVSNVKETMKIEMMNENIKRIVEGEEVTDDTPVAEVNGTPVYYGDVKRAIESMGVHGKGKIERDPRAIGTIVERISMRQGLYDYAKKEQVDKGKMFQSVKNNYVSSILIDLLIDNDIRKNVHVTDEEVKKTYDDHPEMFESGTKVSARHILVDDEKSALDIYKKIQEGEDFGAMAKQFSKDPSAAKGGELGSFGRGVMVEPFEEAAFSMKKGEISKPVHTRFGYHIIQVTDRQNGKLMPYEEARDRLKKHLLDRKMNAEIDSLIDELKEKATIRVVDTNLDFV